VPKTKVTLLLDQPSAASKYKFFDSVLLGQGYHTLHGVVRDENGAMAE
jgi:hypothetical protein